MSHSVEQGQLPKSTDAARSGPSCTKPGKLQRNLSQPGSPLGQHSCNGKRGKIPNRLAGFRLRVFVFVLGFSSQNRGIVEAWARVDFEIRIADVGGEGEGAP